MTLEVMVFSFLANYFLSYLSMVLMSKVVPNTGRVVLKVLVLDLSRPFSKVPQLNEPSLWLAFG